jgi:hypothetical protein
MGPLVLGRLLGLNDTAGRADVVSRLRRQRAALLDVRICGHARVRRRKRQPLHDDYGNISAASIGAIQRGPTAVDEQGASMFFGEPMLNVTTPPDFRRWTRCRQRPHRDRLLMPRLYEAFCCGLSSSTRSCPKSATQKPVVVLLR